LPALASVANAFYSIAVETVREAWYGKKSAGMDNVWVSD